jgi:hypothetical protein
MAKRTFIPLSGMLTLITLALFLSAKVAEASCPIKVRANFSTTWAFCNVSTAFQSKVRAAISIWNASDDYSYTEKPSACVYAFSWSQASFSAKSWGTVPGTTFLSFDGGGKVTGAISYFNTDKSGYDSTCDGCAWPPNTYERQTIALHARRT